MEELIICKEPEGTVAEAYRVMCAKVLAALGEKKVVEVTSVSDAGNTCTVVANLAVAMAQAGKNVLVIDCNLRNPKQHELFCLQNKGVAEFSTSGEYYTTFVQETTQSNLFVLAAGSIAGNPAEMLSSMATQDLLQRAKETYDVILLDMPPVTVVSDAIALGTRTDGVLLIITNKKDKVEEAQKAKEMFMQAGISVLGCVLDKA